MLSATLQGRAQHFSLLLPLPISLTIRSPDRKVKRIAAGDRQALAELYAHYQRPLFTYLLQLTPDHGLAEELLQDTLVAVWKSARTFEERSSVLTWLSGVAALLACQPFALLIGGYRDDSAAGGGRGRRDHRQPRPGH